MQKGDSVNGVEYYKRKKNIANNAVLQFSKLIDFSTNENSRVRAAISSKVWTNQRTDIVNESRKRKADWRQDNLDSRKPKWMKVQLG